MVSLLDVVREVHVSKITVSRVLNHPDQGITQDYC